MRIVTQTYADQLRAEAARLGPEVAYYLTDAFTIPLNRLSEAEQQFAKAWSGSNFGYHSCVYYTDFQSPPPGVRFSVKHGLRGAAAEWVELQRDEVRAAIRLFAGDPNIEPLEARADKARRLLDDARASVVSILSAFLVFSNDEYVAGLKNRAEKLSLSPTRAVFPRMLVTSFDALAMVQGIQWAPHEEVRAEVKSIRHPFKGCEELMKTAIRAADHIDRLSQRPETFGDRQRGTRVFIGHGRSSQWRELKDFVSDRLRLPYDEFNRVPVAGTTNVDRLSQMLDNAAVAFLVLTAEDERADGAAVARQNVVHEAGLFQGRLGFSRAIIMLEGGCEQFSNADGLGQIRFPAGNVSATFEEVRQVLEREGLIQP
jgi:hypothetical protein